MAIHFDCPWCTETISVDDSKARERVECPHCNRPVKVPTKSTCEPPSPLPSSPRAADTPVSGLDSVVSEPPPPPASPPQPPQTATTAEVPTTGFFLYIPKARLVVMSLVTLALYQVYWFYRNWRFLKERDNLRIQPFWRAIFGIFFIHSLLTAIKNDRAGNNILPATFSPGALATGWIIFALVGRIISWRSSDLVVNIFGLIISVSTFAFLLPAQNYINRVNESLPIRPGYFRWSAGQIVMLVYGILLWLLLMFGIVVWLFAKLSQS
jgi:hypothetical protein